MTRKLITLLLLCATLSGCVRALLISEDRDGLIVFYRERLQQREISDISAQEYCQGYQKPHTWISTKMTKSGGYHDTYKCGVVPPAQMEAQKENKTDIPPARSERRERRQNSNISGDYFSSRPTNKNDNNW